MGEGYLLENGRPQAGERFTALAELLDPVTDRHFDRLGVTTGWRCWEIGAGGPSIPDRLALRVGPEGRVVATDLDTTWLTAAGPGVEVLRHDIAVDPPPSTDFDLVHARLVFTHVPARDAALRTAVGALRPGGWLLLEDADPGLQPLLCPDEHGPEQRLANRLRQAFRTLLTTREATLTYGRTLPRRLREEGLTDVGAEGFFPLTHPASATLERATVEHVADRLVDAGLATRQDLDRHLANLAAGLLPDLTTAPLISAWGRRPDQAR
ncbi:methyltransferase domain-containing protein [Actinosynnema sp. NPDC020468]|uniref:methyltransferase domain-containing protein n=1 Tax=Actinosynnema sp. NPDC020468 TaxID=3154488 RepID=UPI0033DDA460